MNEEMSEWWRRASEGLSDEWRNEWVKKRIGTCINEGIWGMKEWVYEWRNDWVNEGASETFPLFASISLWWTSDLWGLGSNFCPAGIWTQSLSHTRLIMLYCGCIPGLGIIFISIQKAGVNTLWCTNPWDILLDYANPLPSCPALF